MRTSYVYLFGSAAYGWCKVGMSDQPMRRYKNLYNNLPFPISIWDVRRVPSRRHAAKLETKLHRSFAECRANGEWFYYRSFDIEKYLKLVKRYENAFEGANPLKEYS